MRALHIFACVAMLVAIASADEEEEEAITIYVSEEAEIIYECAGQSAEQCAGSNGFCVEDGGHCNGTFNIIHNSCQDHCSCCLPAGAVMATETPPKIAPNECYSRDRVPCSEFPDGENFPHSKHCNKFFKCEGGRVVVKTCNYGKLYNHLTGWCEYDMDEEDCMCPMKSSDSQGCPDDFYSPDGSNQCFKFFNDRQRTWKEAKTKCEEEGLQMAEPTDDIAVTLRKVLLDAYGDGGAWLGARGDGLNYVWLTSGVDLTSYSNLLRPGSEGNNILRTHCLGLVVTKGASNRFPDRPYGIRACSRDYYTLCEKSNGHRTKKAVGGSQSSRQSRPR